MKEVVVAAVQLSSVLGDVAQNARRMCRWLERAAASGAHMVVFPECSLTGYGTEEASILAVGSDCEAARQVEACAQELGVAVGYGYIERSSGTDLPYITYVVAFGEERLAYRKTHLGRNEQAFFLQGDELPVAEIHGVRVGIQLCWEGHIPDIATTLRAKGTELLLAPHASGLGGARRVESWLRYLPARAQDNGMYVIACNALHAADPDDQSCAPSGVKGGGLAAFGPDGKLLDSYTGSDEHMLVLHVGGPLPRELSSTGMTHISYFDRRRPELYVR